MLSQQEALRAKTQRTLIDLLHTELEVGPTFVESALLAKGEGHTDDYVRAKQHAVKAAEAVRRFMGRVADDTVRTEISGQVAELDRLISTL